MRARETGKRREKNSSRTGSRVPTGTREAHSTRDGIRWDKRSKRDGDRKSGGSHRELFFSSQKKKKESRPKSESIARAFSHEREKPNATTLRLTPSATEAVGVSFARPTEIGAGNRLVFASRRFSAALDGVARRVTDGDFLSPLPRFARRSALPRPLSRRAARHARREERLARIRASASERVAMSAALGAFAAETRADRCPPPTTTWSNVAWDPAPRRTAADERRGRERPFTRHSPNALPDHRALSPPFLSDPVAFHAQAPRSARSAPRLCPSTSTCSCESCRAKTPMRFTDCS